MPELEKRTSTAPESREQPSTTKQNGYIVGPLFDLICFILAPLWALLLAWVLSESILDIEPIEFLGTNESPLQIFLGTFIMAHLFIVIFRSHGNAKIRGLYPYRFYLVPMLLFLGMVWSPWILVSVSVLAVWWDVYHSGMQTFGLGRLYDLRAGNNAKTARRLDMVLNQLVYAGPILGGITLADHLEDFNEFTQVGSIFFSNTTPAYIQNHQSYPFWGLIIFAAAFIPYYLWSYYRLAKEGYRVSYQKVLLYVLTAIVSVYSWGFNSFGQAFFIMNFFHAWQYFAIIWWAEGSRIGKLFHLETIVSQEKDASGVKLRHTLKRMLTLLLFVGIAFAYGLWAELGTGAADSLIAITLVVSIMHFWYDGFIWSVRKKQV